MPRDLLYPPSVKPGIPKLGKKPEGWSKVKFRDILEEVERPAVMDNDVPYQLVNAKRGRGGIVPRETLLGQEIKTKTQFFVKEGDFLISKRQIVHGACGLVPRELNNALVSNEYSTLIAKKDLCLKFFNYYSYTIHFQQTCFHSSVGVAIEKMIFRINEWMKHDLYLPPLSEQKKIAQILGTWDEAIVKTEKLIAAKQKLKKALMQLLLTGKKRFKEFKAQNWKEANLSDYCVFKGGSTFKREHQGYSEGDIPFIKVSDMNHNDNRIYIYKANNWITTDNQKNTGTTIFPTNTIVFAKVGAALLLNKRRILTRDTAIDNNMMGAIPKNNINYHFLYQYMLTIDFSKFVQEGALPSINQSHLSSLNVKFPELKEQQRIASVLNMADQEIELLQKQLEAMKQQKKGLMQKLLIGKIRVKV